MDSNGIDDGFAVPPGMLRARIEQLATILVKLEMEKGAEVAMKKREAIVLKKLSDYPYLARDHPYFPFFESRLRMFKANPHCMPKFKNKEEVAAAEASAAAAANSKIELTEQERLEARERKIREEALAMAELEAKRDRTDPYPNAYSLQMPTGVSISRPVFDVMVLAAQCAAKVGLPFMDHLTKTYKADNRLFSFISNDDPAYPTFVGLVDSYSRILRYKPNEVQDRLEVFEKGGDALQNIFTAKANFLKAEAARTKAAALTDDELRKRLRWDTFVVKRAFTVADLGLAPAAKAEAAAPPSSVSSSAVPAGSIGWGEESDTAGGSSSAAAPAPSGAVALGTYEVAGIAKRSGNSEYVKDPHSGELVHISQVSAQRRGGGSDHQLGSFDSVASGIVANAGQKRDRNDGLASDAAFEANLKKL